FFVAAVSSSLLVYYYFPDYVAVVFPSAFAAGPGHFYKTISLLPLPKRVVFLFLRLLVVVAYMLSHCWFK
ncbi:hypothetical protein S83_004623, partial [Arachis hypogaea]